MPVPKPRQIIIDAALNGYIVRVGCQTVVFEGRPRLLANLEGYLTSPAEFEKKFEERALYTRSSVEAADRPCVQPGPPCNVGESLGGICDPRAAQYVPESLGQCVPQTNC